MVKASNPFIDRLNHKDVSIRRKAVRTLFEMDDPQNLEAFHSLLSDKDSWFRSKALEAHRMWASKIGISSLEYLANHRSIDAKRCAANLLEEFEDDTSKIAEILLKQDDMICQIKASKALIKFDKEGKYTEKFLSSENEKIVSIALSSKVITKEQLIESLEDKPINVKNVALKRLQDQNYNIDDEILLKLIDEGVEGKETIPFAINNAGKCLIKIANSNESKIIKNLVLELKNKFNSIEEPVIQLLIENKCHVVLGRWLQGRKDTESDKLRWQIIENEEVDEIERSRLLERLLGRVNEEEIKIKSRELLESTNSELLKIIAHNLSTAGD